MFSIFFCRFILCFVGFLQISFRFVYLFGFQLIFLSRNVHNQPENPKNPQEPQNQNPPQEEQQIAQPEPIARPPLGTQENIINDIERGKTELERVIARLKESGQTNPMRAQLASSLESINTQIASVSGQLDV